MRPRLVLPLLGLAALLTGCPSPKEPELRIQGLSSGSFSSSLRQFHNHLSPAEFDAFARCLLFLHLEDPIAARTAPASLQDLLLLDISSDLRIQINGLTAPDLTRYARGRFLGLIRARQEALAALDNTIATRADELAAAADSQAILRDLVIDPTRIRLERIPGVNVVRANLQLENRTGRPLSAALLRVRMSLSAGAAAEEEITLTFTPVLAHGETREMDRVLSQAVVPDPLDPSRLSFEVVNAYDQRQAPLARVLDRGAATAVARLRTERAELAAHLAALGRADDYPYLRLEPERN